jgi:hypothetical protein
VLPLPLRGSTAPRLPQINLSARKLYSRDVALAFDLSGVVAKMALRTGSELNLQGTICYQWSERIPAKEPDPCGHFDFAKWRAIAPGARYRAAALRAALQCPA